jgi:hypothetical protein
MSTVKLFSDCFSPADTHDHYSVSPSVSLWRKWMEENPHAQRLFLRIYHPEREDDEGTFLVPVGDPVQAENGDNAIYLPTWMIDTNKYSGCGEETIVEVLDTASLPRATRIVLRPVDSALHEVDVVSVFEQSFSRLGVLQEGKLYLIPLEELGGFHVSVYVEKLEPAKEVYMDGDEIPLEFERPVDYVEPPPRPPTPVPEPIPLLAPAQTSDFMVPSNMLGGGEEADLNQTYQPQPRGRRGVQQVPSGFVPFSGQGRRLDGK